MMTGDERRATRRRAVSEWASESERIVRARSEISSFELDQGNTCAKDHRRRRTITKRERLQKGFDVSAGEDSVATRAREARWRTRR